MNDRNDDVPVCRDAFVPCAKEFSSHSARFGQLCGLRLGHDGGCLPNGAGTEEQEDALAQRVLMPLELHPNTKKLVVKFACALAAKLAVAQAKYGYSDGWRDAGWVDECRVKLREHVEKGDPRDVAAYCAFLWYHSELTSNDLAKPSETCTSSLEAGSLPEPRGSATVVSRDDLAAKLLGYAGDAKTFAAESGNRAYYEEMASVCSDAATRLLKDPWSDAR